MSNSKIQQALAAASVVPCLLAAASQYGNPSQKGRMMGTLRSLGALARATGNSMIIYPNKNRTNHIKQIIVKNFQNFQLISIMYCGCTENEKVGRMEALGENWAIIEQR